MTLIPHTHRFLGPRLELRHPHRRSDGHAERPSDHLGPYDSGADFLFGDFHAVRACGDAEEPAAVRVPCCEFWGADHAGISVYSVLEVSGASLSLSLSLSFSSWVWWGKSRGGVEFHCGGLKSGLWKWNILEGLEGDFEEDWD